MLDEWTSWQAQGMDRKSVIADPLFVNPDKDDYRLKPESPAFKLGFQPIPIEKIGPYSSELRASWPIVEVEARTRKTPGDQGLAIVAESTPSQPSYPTRQRVSPQEIV